MSTNLLCRDSVIPASEMRQHAVTSAQQYLDFLDSAKGFHGKKIVSVVSIVNTGNPSEYILTLSEKIGNPDSCEIWIDGEPAEGIEISKNVGNRQIRILDSSDIIGDAFSFFPERIKLVSDMRFLVRRLKDFYACCTLSLRPPAPIAFPELPDELMSGLSEEQISAVRGVCASSLSYVNGAPGTGKTNMVLSRCVLRYILNDKRVFLLAPTNNAVEQMLRGILPTLQKAGILMERVYRLGTSSEEFAKQYPQVVGDSSTEALLDDLQRSEKEILKEMRIAKQLQSECDQKEEQIETCGHIHRLVEPMIRSLDSLRSKLSEAIADADKSEAYCHQCRSECDQLAKQKEAVETDLHAHERVIHNNTEEVKHFSYRIWKREKRRQLIAETEQLRSESTQLKVNYEILLLLHKESSDKYDQAVSACKDCQKRAAELREKCQNLSVSILAISARDKTMCGILNSILKRNALSTKPLDEYVETLRHEYISLSQKMEMYSVADIQMRLDDVKRQLNEIGSSAKQIQKKHALVLAGTIDASLNSLIPYHGSDPYMPISHVFLDEAGYTSLIRGLAAFACNAPVTFLGDHNQLPPVCEMNTIDEEHAPVCLWSLSVAYYSELVSQPFHTFYHNCYCAGSEPSFCCVDFFSLDVSYRFGPELADILSKHIYANKIRGVGEGSFEINVVHADYSSGPYIRSNSAELYHIRNYIFQNSPEDFAVLTPYNGQKKLLLQTLPQYCRDSILTVHRSQGREWDTVIFSVVDASNRYFTDSNLSIGRHVINTAISRAKRKLVIVCDTNVWSQLPDQIICDLIRCGKRIFL